MRYFAATILFAGSSLQAQTFTPQGFRNAVNAEQNQKKTQPVIHFNPRPFEDAKAKLIRSLNKSSGKQVDPKGYTIYGVRLGDTVMTYKYDANLTYLCYMQGVECIEINWGKSMIEPPSPLKRVSEFDTAKGFVLIAKAKGIIIGVGIIAISPKQSFARGMQEAALSKCVGSKIIPPDLRQGLSEQMRDRLGEVLGATDNGVVVTFTDRTRPGSKYDEVAITYIDPFLASQIGPYSVDSSGF